MKYLKIALESKNEEQAVKAVEKLTDQRLLTDIARSKVFAMRQLRD